MVELFICLILYIKLCNYDDFIYRNGVLIYKYLYFFDYGELNKNVFFWLFEYMVWLSVMFFFKRLNVCF